MTFQLVTRAIAAGIVAGLVASVLQLWFVQPVILHAEMYESGELQHFGETDAMAGHDHGDGHGDGGGIDLGRDALTVVFTALIYTGWAFVMLPAMALAGRFGHAVNGRNGVIWGVAGFVVAMLAPGFSLPPDVPGVAVADIEVRQYWWLATVCATGLGLWLIAFGETWAARGAAVILILAPHLIGAPEPEEFIGVVPPELAAHMVARAYGVGLAVWVVLGSVAGFLWARAVQQVPAPA